MSWEARIALCASNSVIFSTAIAGAGPGGTGPLVYAAQAGLLDSWLARGVAVIDRADAFGGTIGRYGVNSDTLGGVYLECLNAPAARARFGPLNSEFVTKELQSMARSFPPLPLVGKYFSRFGAFLEQAVDEHASSAFFSRTEVRSLHLSRDGSISLLTACAGTEQIVQARTAILALGGRPNSGTALAHSVSRRCAPDKVMSSDELLTSEGLKSTRCLLSRSRRPSAVILGGSHSAYSAAWALTSLADLPVPIGNDAIAILGRREPKIFYPTRADARADGYEFIEEDICPRTQRVNRLAGLRGDGRELWRRMSSKPGTIFEGRVKSVRLPSWENVPTEVLELLDHASLIVRAYGYSARTVPIFGANGRHLRLKADTGGPAVDDEGRILLANGRALENIFGIGLGSGFRPQGAMGGEPSFRGQANSLWLYQNDIGATIYSGIQRYLGTTMVRASHVQRRERFA